ncbi:MAG: alpha/beta hydrolase [Pseudomonadota bacterium]
MYIEINGARLFFDIAGTGVDPATMQPKPTLLMLHGGPGYDQSTLRPHFDRFADTHQVIYIDHRGCGRSGGDPKTWTLDQWADDVAAFCAALRVERPVIFGQSFGGMVAMRTAARHPELASKLILSSTAARFDVEATVAMAQQLGGAVAAAAARALFTLPTLEAYKSYAELCLPLYNPSTEARAALRGNAIQKPEVTIHFFANEMLGMDLRPGLAAVKCPTLVLAGAQDPVTPTICAKEIAAAIPHAALHVFESCGHGVHRDQPDESAALMRRFLAA